MTRMEIRRTRGADTVSLAPERVREQEPLTAIE